MYRDHSTAFAPVPDSIEFPINVSEPPTIMLTKREREVLQWAAAGKSSWEIGRIFDCTEAGVNYHFYNIRRKFGVSSRRIAIVQALEQGLIEFPYGEHAL